VRHDYFDEAVAARYDMFEVQMFAPDEVEATVAFLAEQVGTGGALEFGIGTGRIALPLSRTGVPVAGIDLSTAMVARLREKQGTQSIEVAIGDFATTRVAASFDLVYLVFNTINNLTTQEDQVACFANASSHLKPGGRFVIEVGVPDLQRLPPGETVRVFTLTDGYVGFDEYDVANQGLVSHHYRVVDGRLDRISIPFRYVWPSELDLMARLAGMSLRERWSDWNRAAFTADSRKHVSVWEKAT
jgi:SAM-dependent methyltransferase